MSEHIYDFTSEHYRQAVSEFSTRISDLRAIMENESLPPFLNIRVHEDKLSRLQESLALCVHQISEGDSEVARSFFDTANHLLPESFKLHRDDIHEYASEAIAMRIENL